MYKIVYIGVIHMEKIFSPSEFASMLNVSVKTLQRWDKKGILVANRSLTNRRYYTQSQYNEYFGLNNINNNKYNVAYCRVSNRGQQDDLYNQILYIRNYIQNNGLELDDVITDIGSGLNFKRKNWNKLIDDCIAGKIDTIYVAHADRFIRFGFDWFKEFLESRCNTRIKVINNVSMSPETELVQDLISIIHVFSCRIYGLRKYKKKIKKDLDI